MLDDVGSRSVKMPCYVNWFVACSLRVLVWVKLSPCFLHSPHARVSFGLVSQYQRVQRPGFGITVRSRWRQKRNDPRLQFKPFEPKTEIIMVELFVLRYTQATWAIQSASRVYNVMCGEVRGSLPKLASPSYHRTFSAFQMIIFFLKLVPRSLKAQLQCCLIEAFCVNNPTAHPVYSEVTVVIFSAFLYVLYHTYNNIHTSVAVDSSPEFI